jgi:hypothetical protein
VTWLPPLGEQEGGRSLYLIKVRTFVLRYDDLVPITFERLDTRNYLVALRVNGASDTLKAALPARKVATTVVVVNFHGFDFQDICTPSADTALEGKVV